MLALKPLPGHILVELRDEYEHVAITEKKYDTRTSGICIRQKENINSDVYEEMTGKRVFWDEYKEGKVIKREGKKYAFIKFEDVIGYEDVEA